MKKLFVCISVGFMCFICGCSSDMRQASVSNAVESAISRSTAIQSEANVRNLSLSLKEFNQRIYAFAMGDKDITKKLKKNDEIMGQIGRRQYKGYTSIVNYTMLGDLGRGDLFLSVIHNQRQRVIGIILTANSPLVDKKLFDKVAEWCLVSLQPDLNSETQRKALEYIAQHSSEPISFEADDISFVFKNPNGGAVFGAVKSFYDYNKDLNEEGYFISYLTLGDKESVIEKYHDTGWVKKNLGENKVLMRSGGLEVRLENGMITQIVSKNREEKTNRKVGPGSKIQDVIKKYGEGYEKSEYDGLILYEYTFDVKKGKHGIIRFAVQPKTKIVDSVSMRYKE